VRGSDWYGGGGLDNLLELAQGDLSHFDMQLQMHLKNDLHEGKHNEQLVLPRVKNAGNFKNLPPPKSKDDGRERSLSPSKSPSKAPPKSKESPLKLLPNREPRGAVGILFRLYSGSIQALFRLYSGSIQALFRLYSDSIQALFRNLRRIRSRIASLDEQPRCLRPHTLVA
jgi:hypothetical protein